jgi:HK97 family phage major capsid protein
MEYLRTGAKMKGLISSNLKSNAAALQEGTTTEGGFLVPNDLMAGIIVKRDETSILRKAGATVKTTSRDVADFVSENGSMVEFVITAEEGAVDEDEPTFSNPQATIYNMTKLVKVSTQLLEDTDADLVGTINEMFGRAWGLTENKYFCAGTGSSQPQGITYGGTAGLTLDSAAYVHSAEIPELYYKLGSQYMDGAGWVMKNATLGLIQGLVGDNFQFVPTPAGSMQPMLWSKPVWVSDAMPAATAGLKAIAFGNYAYYGWAERKVMSVQRLNELYAGTGQVGFLATVRVGGVVLQAEAIQYGTMAGS